MPFPSIDQILMIVVYTINFEEFSFLQYALEKQKRDQLVNWTVCLNKMLVFWVSTAQYYPVWNAIATGGRKDCFCYEG